MVSPRSPLLDFWKRTLPVHERVHFRGAIPPDKLFAVCQVYQLADAGNVLVLFDDTLFGGGEDGFVLTTTHFGHKSIAEPPRLLALGSLSPNDVQHHGASFTLAGEAVHVAGVEAPLVAAAARALRQTIAGLRRGGGGLYRSAPNISASEILASLTERLPESEDLYFEGALPARKLSNVTKLYGIGEGERVLVIYDDTIFGSAAEGFVVTDRRICFKGTAEDPMSVELKLLSPADVGVEGGVVSIKGKPLELTGDGVAIARGCCEALQAIVRGS